MLYKKDNNWVLLSLVKLFVLIDQARPIYLRGILLANSPMVGRFLVYFFSKISMISLSTSSIDTSPSTVTNKPKSL